MMPPASRFPDPFPPQFASAWGDDAFGLWADFSLPVSGNGDPVRQRLRWIEPGTFKMGSPNEEPERLFREGPQHKVTISQGFWLADTACTQALWLAVMDSNPSYFTDDLNQPVERVNWQDVQAFLQRLQTLLPDYLTDLPSEAEWEYACRAGTDTPFCFGLKVTQQLVNCQWKFNYIGGEQGRFIAKTVQVKTLPANQWGLYEMHGNVDEWCKDGERSYDEQAQIDPLGQLSGYNLLRTVRGGSYSRLSSSARSAFRHASPPRYDSSTLGFRFCLRPIESTDTTGGPTGLPGRASGASPR